LDKTIIFVTHDMDEAVKLATQMVIMNEGKVIQDDTPVNILHQPANEFVKNLLGEDRLEEAQHYTVQVGEIMLTDPVKINIGASLTQALSVMKNRHVDTLLVTDDSNHLKGFISVSKLDKRYHHVDSVSDILETKLATLHPDSYLRDYAGKILQGNMTYVPVVDHQDKLVGIVTRSALVNLVYSTIWGSTEGNIQGADKHE
ncbi:CBS domain-containing protein, partial [Lactobacillus sp. XV13L]|nr:CBS domain-containing protein [Lactobacillus sp. XV13L]